ncbi:type II toxin-antitoxin system PemK/MazF family toxin [Microbacterium sp. zg-YB36]|uniref:type II toxin-antitoxin system PemK/MazF family toxin n=1 Tax=Microbacterium sp. zg-YB36 TaxID=2969407 RepID=UPI00214BA841|nr:type II toxin-antitoxin system PemK/MazF family toxin [Microbacterium sp. zg-YB36]MDL5350239.1 type II toxin-antitoxin system PemK/MazF family toxin [Microbacterium sp. zg-YB36]
MSTRGFLQRLASLLRPSRRPMSRAGTDETPGRSGATATIGLAPPAALRIAYSPDPDGEPDAGEVVWTWVPYAERDGRGKDRPVLVIAPQNADRVYALRLTSAPHDGEANFVPIGAGEWDSKGRPSWVDIGQLYSVHTAGMRREAAAVDRSTFARVAAALKRRYGWRVAG